jgi:hypothetical protein
MGYIKSQNVRCADCLGISHYVVLANLTCRVGFGVGYAGESAIPPSPSPIAGLGLVATK